MTAPVLAVDGLRKAYAIERGVLRRKVGEVVAVDDVSFSILAGETLGLVGESGCGKTTVGRCILRLVEPTGGKVQCMLPGGAIDVARAPQRELGPFRRQAQMIFQDPFASLNPRWRIGRIVAEPLVAQGASRREATRQAIDFLKTVELDPTVATRFPHELSGGQRQRVGIARAMIVNPSLVIADEAVSALDVSVRAQIINLMLRLQRERGTAYLFISHDLSIVRHVCDRICVMYLGRIVEQGERDIVFGKPAHPYTRALLKSALVPDPARANLTATLEGEVPSPAHPPSGCHFRTRCPFARVRCAEEIPQLRTLSDGRAVRCHFAEALPEATGGADPAVIATV